MRCHGLMPLGLTPAVMCDHDIEIRIFLAVQGWSKTIAKNPQMCI